MGAKVSRSLVLACLAVALVACGGAREDTRPLPATRPERAPGLLAAASAGAARARPPGDSPARSASSRRGDEVLAAVADSRDDLRAPPERHRAELVDSVVAEVFFADRDDRAIALTFDDGPSRENTPRILEVLEREDVPATFFVLGERAAKMPDLLEAIDEGGHEIGNHTWSHGSLRSMWASQIRDELQRTNDAVFSAIGRRPALFRPPFGRYAPSALPIVGELEMNVVLWSVDGEDWDRDPEAIASLVVGEASAGDIVLLHDRTSTTAAALAAIIRGLRARGFRLVTVSELTGLRAYAPATGSSASPMR